MPVDMQSFIERAHTYCEIGTKPYREAIRHVVERSNESLKIGARQVGENRLTISDDDITR